MASYLAPWSTFLKVVSAGITILLLGAFWFSSSISTVDESLQFQIFMFILPILILGLSAIFIIRRYELTENEIVIVRFVGRTRFPLKQIEQAEYDPQAAEFAMRVLGNGGLYSYSGLFRNNKLGRFRAYFTNKANTVILHRKNGMPIVISPENPESFAKDLNSRL